MPTKKTKEDTEEKHIDTVITKQEFTHLDEACKISGEPSWSGFMREAMRKLLLIVRYAKEDPDGMITYSIPKRRNGKKVMDADGNPVYIPLWSVPALVWSFNPDVMSYEDLGYIQEEEKEGEE